VPISSRYGVSFNYRHNPLDNPSQIARVPTVSSRFASPVQIVTHTLRARDGAPEMRIRMEIWAEPTPGVVRAVLSKNGQEFGETTDNAEIAQTLRYMGVPDRAFSRVSRKFCDAAWIAANQSKA
jgi:hypothetical protein